MPSAGQPRRRVSIDGRPTVSSSVSSPKSGPRLRSLRRPKALALSIVAPVVLIAAVATGMAPANACEPLIQAGADCTGTVSFTATAWNDSDATDESRTNNNVKIQYSLNGADGPFETVKSSGVRYAFNKDNGFTFKDSFQLPANVKRDINITVQAVAVSKWGPNEDIDQANQTHKKTVHVPAECEVPSTPATAPEARIVPPTCDDAKTYAVLTNPSKQDVKFVISKNGVSPEEVSVPSGSNTRELSIREASTISISAPGMQTVERTIAMPVDCDQSVVSPVASTETVCKGDGSGWTVTYDNSKSTVAQTFVLRTGNRIIDTVAVNAGRTQVASYSFATNGVPQASSIPLTISAGDKVVQTKSIANDCWSSSAAIGIACDTPAGSGALLSFTNTGEFADTFTVTRDGRAVAGAPFTLQPGDHTTQKLLRLNNNDTANIMITSTSGLNVQKAVTLQCTTDTKATSVEVKDEIIDRPSLAGTGFDVTPFVAFGSAFFLLGTLFLAVRRFV